MLYLKKSYSFLEIMGTKETINKKGINLRYGYKGLLEIINLRKDILQKKVFVYCLSFSILTTLVTYFLDVDTFEFIVEIKDQILSLVPSLLGFTLAGYTLLVAFIQPGMLNRITEKSQNSGFSLYERMSGIFALNIIIQALALIIAYFFHIIIFIGEKKSIDILIKYSVINIINYVGLIIILFCLSISLILVLQIVVSIFNFSQLHQYFIIKEKEPSDKE